MIRCLLIALGFAAAAPAWAANLLADGNAPPVGIDLRQFGVKFDNVTDNSAALQTAFNSCALGNALLVPATPLPALFATGVVATLSSAVGTACSVIGQGMDVALLEYTGSGTAITVRYPSIYQGTHWRDFSLLTNNTSGSPVGIYLQGIGNPNATGGSGHSQVSDFTRVGLRGADGIGQVDYWGTAISVYSVSSINFNGIEIWGNCSLSPGCYLGTVGTGIKLNGQSGNNGPAVAINCTGCFIGYTGIGIEIVNQVQGLTVSQSNIVFDQAAIQIDSGASDIYQVNINSSSFNFAVAGINLLGAVFALNVSDNLFIVNGNGATAFLDSTSATNSQFQFIGNTCDRQAGTATICAAINSATRGAIINDNYVANVNAGFTYSSAATNVSECHNHFNNLSSVNVSMQANAGVRFCGGVMFGGSVGTTLASNSTGYVGLGVSATTENLVNLIATTSGFLYGLQVTAAAPPGAGQSYVTTMRVGGANTQLACTISGASVTACADGNMTHAQNSTFAAGNPIDLGVVTSATAAATVFNWTVNLATDY
jgi:hypothetical protein